MMWQRATFFLFLQIGRVLAASRPDNQTICDYYAEQRYGSSNLTTQLWLMQSIVAYAYAGGDGLSSPVVNSTGVFNEGSFGGDRIFLRSWFDGSKATTNVNGLAVKVDWLDGGGLDPLVGYLNGSAASPKIREGSNQDILFSHWYATFGFIYGCSLAKQFVTKSYAPFTPAYVHKYMDLNQTQVGYFINQFIVASKYYGFSDPDAQQLSAVMNAKYNNQCSPPDARGQLNSVCFAKSCPQAFPQADCAAYSSIEPYGFKASTPTGSATGLVPTVATAIVTATATNTPAAAADGGSSSNLSAGAIAGIAIGGAAVLLLAVGMWLYFRRQQKTKPTDTPATTQNLMSERGSTVYSPPSPYGHPYSQPHDSYYSHNPHDSYVASSMLSPKSPPPPSWEQSQSPHPHELASEHPARSPAQGHHQWGEVHEIAEMESRHPNSR